MVEIYKRLFRPQARAELFPRDYLPWVLKQHFQDDQRLARQFQADAIAAQFFETEIGANSPKLTRRGWALTTIAGARANV